MSTFWAALRARLRRPAKPATTAEHTLWVNRLRLVALVQKYAVPSHPDNCFCRCGIDPVVVRRFLGEIELIAWEMEQRERRRGQ